MRGARDHELVKRSIDGDEKTFRLIVEKNTGIVCSAVRSVLGGCGEIEDIVQDIFIKVYRGLPGFHGRSRLSTWIYRIARNEAINSLSRRRMITLPESDQADIGSDRDRPDRMYGRKMDIARIRRLVGMLDEHYREVIELRYLGEKSYSDIASLLQIPEGTVKTNLHRAKIRLREMIREEDHAGGKDVKDDGLHDS